MKRKSDWSISTLAQNDVDFVLGKAIRSASGSRKWRQTLLFILSLLKRPNIGFIIFSSFLAFLFLGIPFPIAVGCAFGMDFFSSSGAWKYSYLDTIKNTHQLVLDFFLYIEWIFFWKKLWSTKKNNPSPFCLRKNQWITINWLLIFSCCISQKLFSLKIKSQK